MKVCKKCGEEKSLDEFSYNRKEMIHLATCKICTYARRKAVKDGAIPTKDGRWSIARFENLNNWFMTEREISDMYKTLKSHMFIKYGRYDEDVIQHTIIQGMAWADKYDPTRASKIVFFQMILRGIWYHEVDPKLNRRIRHHYSLDWTSDDDSENMDIATEVANQFEEIEIDEGEPTLEDVLDGIINSGKYPLVTAKINKERRLDTLKKHNLNDLKYKRAVEAEIKAIMQTLTDAGFGQLLKWRRASYIRNYITKGGEPNINCKRCGKLVSRFQMGLSFKSQRRFCSEECRLERIRENDRRQQAKKKAKL